MAEGSEGLMDIRNDPLTVTTKAVGGACTPDDSTGDYGVFFREFASELFLVVTRG